MKIEGKKTAIGTDTYLGKTGDSPRVNKAGGGEGGGGGGGVGGRGGWTAQAGDAVEISSRAREFNMIKKMLESVPEARVELVVRLKTDIANGDYNMDASKIAEKMIKRTLRDVLSSKG